MANKEFVVKHGLNPVTDGSIDLGTSSLEFKDLYIDGTAFLDAVGFGTTAITLPSGAGSNGQVLKSNGSNALAWADDTAGTITALNNQTADRLVTIGSTTTQLDGEANLTFNGSILTVAGTANAKMLNISASGAALGSQNAFKIILVDLTDPATMWDVQAFLARARFTSWYQELGAPPMRGAMFITNAKTSLVWWNLDTDTQYAKFDTGGSSNDDSNMLYFSASSPPVTLTFLDGKLFFGADGGGVWIIDFLRDECIGWFQSGQRRYEGNIEERNDGKGNGSTRTSFVLLSNTVNAIAAVRDPLSVDEFDRPKHWWAAATNIGTGGGSGNVYNPVNDAIYTSTMGSDLDAIAMSQSGKMWWMRDSAPDSVYGYNIYSVYASGLGAPNYMPQANWNGGSIGNSGSAVIVDLAAFDAPNGFDGLAVATNAGLDLGFMTGTTATNQNTESAHIFITSTYQTPYMKGDRKGAYPLNDVNDRSGNGHNLTNNNSTTFTSGPFGNTATFNGTNQTLTDTGEAGWAVAAGNSLTVSFYFKSTTATNPSADESFVFLASSPLAAYVQVSIMSSGGRLQTEFRNSSIQNETANGSGDYIDAEWHHVVATYKVGRGLELWADGLKIGEETNTTWEQNVSSYAECYVGGISGGQYFDGQMAQLSICESAWTETEIKAEYQRMLRGLGGATATLANTDVKSVRVDQNTGLAAVTTAANQTEIWDLEMGLRQSIDGTTTATIADADVRLKTGATLPEYITARSGAIEFDGQTRSVID